MIPPKVIELYKEVSELLTDIDIFADNYKEIQNGIAFNVMTCDSYGQIRIYYSGDNYAKLDLSLLRLNPHAARISKTVDEEILARLSIRCKLKGIHIRQ